MMKFDQEALSNCFDSLSIANEIRLQFNLKPNEPAPLYEISKAVGIWKVTEKSLSSIEGALVVPDGKIEGEILLNTNQHPERKRFTFAHELGHFLHPLHHPSNKGKFECTKKDIFQSYNRQSIPEIENQANDFASALLLPSDSINPIIEMKSLLSFGEIQNLCEKMQISYAFAIRKLQRLCLCKTAFVFSHRGKVRYLQCENFPFIKIWSKNPLPEQSYSMENGSDNTIMKKREISPNIWLKSPTNKKLFEQTYIQENDYRITMLILE